MQDGESAGKKARDLSRNAADKSANARLRGLRPAKAVKVGFKTVTSGFKTVKVGCKTVKAGFRQAADKSANARSLSPDPHAFCTAKKPLSGRRLDSWYRLVDLRPSPPNLLSRLTLLRSAEAGGPPLARCRANMAEQDSRPLAPSRRQVRQRQVLGARFRAKREQLKRLQGLLPERYAQNLVLAVL